MESKLSNFKEIFLYYYEKDTALMIILLCSVGIMCVTLLLMLNQKLLKNKKRKNLANSQNLDNIDVSEKGSVMDETNSLTQMLRKNAPLVSTLKEKNNSKKHTNDGTLKKVPDD